MGLATPAARAAGRSDSRRTAAYGPSFNSETLAAKADEGRVIRASSLAALARETKMNVAPLLGTIAKYNEDVGRARDSAYLKAPVHLRPVATPPFYAVEVRPAIIAWTGAGLRIDADARVIGGDERPIPGLYAAGETVGTFHGDVYIGGGGSYGPAVTFGRVAGANAAEEALASPDR